VGPRAGRDAVEKRREEKRREEKRREEKRIFPLPRIQQ
jgi:hypothetical protein